MVEIIIKALQIVLTTLQIVKTLTERRGKK